ncbi:MAG: type II toxin-antitoxin system RelE/ParE family toxin [Chloroflexi bacterium]|nr:type II toxin-antitoxin system RelE/ParE family toxin [Chloroflexota bacterium]
MSVEWTRKATRDVRVIHAHIADQDPATADTVLEEIGEAADRADAFPYAGYRSKNAGCREMRAGDSGFVVVYRIGDGHIEVQRVMRGIRRLRS